MAISKVSSPVFTNMKKIADLIAPKDAGATAAMKELGKNNPGAKSISGEEMAAAITKGTEDKDNQAAGKEYTVIKQFVDKNGPKLSPEARKVFDVYKKQVELAKANGQTGIGDRAYAKMTSAMKEAAKPQYLDKSAAEQLNELAKGNKEPGSISGKEMTDAIIKGTQDNDNQAAGKEFKDISKFVKENAQLLSPEAKAAFGVYEKAARAAQAKGQTGIEDGAFQRMARDMAKAGAPKYADAGMGQSLNDLASKNTKPGSISAKELAAAVSTGARDLDGQSAGKEYKDLAKFVKENAQLLSPDAKKAFGMYEKAAKEAQAKGSTSVGTLEQFDKLIKDMGNVGAKPPTAPTAPTGPTAPTAPPADGGGVDASAAKSLDELLRANPGPGSISGKEMAAAIKSGTEDLDNQAAGSEYKQIADFVKKNEGKLSPEAKAAFGVYEKAAKAARAQGETGIPTPTYNKMVKEMEAAGQPKYQDAGMGSELNKLAAANTSPGSITAKQLSEAVSKGARDLDGNSAGKEFEDLAKFVAENQQLLTPDAKAAFALYEKAAMSAREKGSTSIGTLEQFDKLIKTMGEQGATATTMPVPPPAGSVPAPQFPGVDANESQLAKFQVEIQKFFDSLKALLAKLPGATPATPATPVTGSRPPAGGNDLASQALAALSSLREPSMPSKNATIQEQMQFQKDMNKFNSFKDLVNQVIQQTSGLPNPLPNGLKAPPFPSPGASPQELAQFQRDLAKFVAAAKGGTTGSTGSSTGTTGGGSTPTGPSQQQVLQSGGNVADQAIAAIGALQEPAIPGPDATPQELAKYEKDTKRYDRMMELMSSIVKKRDELQMSIIRKL